MWIIKTAKKKFEQNCDHASLDILENIFQGTIFQKQMYEFHAEIKKNRPPLPITCILLWLYTIQNMQRLFWSLIWRGINKGLAFILMKRTVHQCMNFSLPFVQNQDCNYDDNNGESSSASTNKW